MHSKSQGVKLFSVSVIVPVYNGSLSIREALVSLLNQTLGNQLQIVIVDDGSADDSFEIISAYARNYANRIVAIHTDNAGAAHARNIGLSHATGEYVGFLDCDDTADFTMFQKLYELASSEEADIATCGYYRVEGDDVQRRDYARRPCFGYPLTQAPSLIRRNVPYIWNKIFKRSFLEKHSLKFDESLRIYEDLLFTYSSFALANKVVRVHETLYVYNFARENSLTVDFSEKRLDIIPAFTKLLDFYESRGLLLHTEEHVLRSFLTHFYAVLENSSLKSLKSKDARRFVSACFDFLDDRFPWWKKFDLFYKETKRSQTLYGSRLLIHALLMAPESLRFRKFKKERARKRWMRRSRVGRIFLEELHTHDIDPRKVVLDSQRGDNLNGNMYYLLKRFLEDETYSDWTICVTYRTKAARAAFVKLINVSGFDMQRITLQKYNTAKYARNLATARLIFTDTSLPVYFIKREGQTYLNTWHGTPLKCLGRDMEEGFAGAVNLTRNFLAADYLAFQSSYMSECMKSAYMYDGFTRAQTLFEGYPRNEPFVSRNAVPTAAEDVFSAIENPEDDQHALFTTHVQRIAYLPTWRGSATTNTASQTDIPELLLQIDALLTDRQVMYVKLHPYDHSRVAFANYAHIRPFPKDGETYALLAQCDLLVTDYSSVFFDFAATGKPILLFTYDRDDYLRSRGIYLDFEKLGLPCAETPEELVRLIGNSEKYACNSIHLGKKYAPYENTDCSKRLIELCLNEKLLKTARVEPASPRIPDSTLLFCGDLRSSQTTLVVKDLLESPHDNGAVCLTYDVNASCNLSSLKYSDRSVRFFGRSFPLSAITSEEANLLADAELNRSVAVNHKKELLTISKREAQRSWPNITFSRSIVYGPESLNNMILATSCAKHSYVVLDVQHDPSTLATIPAWVMDRFTAIIIPEGMVLSGSHSLPVRRWGGSQSCALSQLLITLE